MAYTTIDKPSEHFTPFLWTGDGTSPKSFTGVGLQADMLWSKIRTDAHQHNIVDTVRGVDQRLLMPDSTNDEDTTCTHGHFDSLDSDGFTITGASGYWNVNTNTKNYVGWFWKGGGTASSNSNGSITSSVSANATAGFSIVSWTGDGSDATIGHGLSSAPKLIIHKHRSGSVQWNVYADVPNAGTGGYLRIDGNNAWGSNSGFFGTAPTATVFSPGSHSYMSGSGNDNIAYCFANVKGYQKIGSYVGNGDSSNGPFVYTGFKPAFVMIKEVNGADVWVMYDNKRLGYNSANYTLEADGNGSEGTATDRFNLLSNGFKITYNWTPNNTSGQTYLYLAIAENPFVTSTGIPATAR